MSTDNQVPQQWVIDLQKGVLDELSPEYKFKARFAYDSDNLYLTFPDIPNEQLDFKQGITRIMSKYNGGMTKEYLYFPKPTQVTPAPIETIQPVSQSPVLQSDNNKPSSEVKQTMSMTIEKYCEKGNGNYVSLKTCKVMDTFTIMETPYFEENEYEGKKRTQLIAKVKKHNPNGEDIDMKMSINKTNAQNLVEQLGQDLLKWVGRRVFIAAKQIYNNGKEGFILAAKQ